MSKTGASIATVFFLSLLAVAAVYAAGEDARQEDGLFSEGSFLSETISSAAGKLNTVTSGKEKIIDDDAKGIPQDTLEYDGNPLSRPLTKPRFRNKPKNDNRV